jgi:hypothetical protein
LIGKQKSSVELLVKLVVRQIIFKGLNTADDFCKWLISPQNTNFTCLAHNAKSYDFYFILYYIFKNGISPSVIYRGSKVLQIIVNAIHLKMIDSISFLPLALAKLPKTFGIKTQSKGFFPHFFSTVKHWLHNGVFENLPTPDMYGYDTMSTTQRTDFMAWYEKQSGPFDFKTEMQAYCINDVEILRKACLQFRDLMINITSEGIQVDPDTSVVKHINAVDPFQYVTIASVCNAIFRAKFVEEEWSVVLAGSGENLARKIGSNSLEVLVDGSWVKTQELDIVRGSEKFVSSKIGQIPSTGYVNRDNFSKISIQWLEYLMHSEQIFIQHALNLGEKVITIGTCVMGTVKALLMVPL